MKIIRLSDGLICDYAAMIKCGGEFMNYWGEKHVGEYDVPPQPERGDTCMRMWYPDIEEDKKI